MKNKIINVDMTLDTIRNTENKSPTVTLNYKMPTIEEASISLDTDKYSFSKPSLVRQSRMINMTEDDQNQSEANQADNSSFSEKEANRRLSNKVKNCCVII